MTAATFTCLRRGTLASVIALAAWVGPVSAEPRTYQIDPEHFSIAFSVKHLGFADVIGLFLKGSGNFVYDEETRALRSGRVVVKANSVFTNHDARDRHVRDSDFLDARSHPDIVFEATAFEPGADGSGRLSGTLSLLGMTRPVALDVRLNKAGTYPFGHRKHTLGISASTTIERSQWGMDYGVDRGMVGDEVTLNFEIEALRD